MPRYEINVNVDPTSQPPATSPVSSNNPTGAANGHDKQLTLGGIAKAAYTGMAIKQIGSIALGSIGDLTGQGQLQRRIDETMQGLGYATQIGLGAATGGLVGGAIATVAVGVQIGGQEVKKFFNRREQSLNADYNKSLTGERIKGNR